MSEALNKGLGTVNYDNLIIRAGDVGHVELAAGQGELPRGAVIDTEGYLMSKGRMIGEEGKQTLIEATPSYILCDDTKTDDTEKTVACVYKNGNFVRNSLYVAQEYELSETDIERLRSVGIIIEDAK